MHKYSRLIERLEGKNKLLPFGDDTQARDIMVQAVLHIKSNLEKTNTNILKMMMEL